MFGIVNTTTTEKSQCEKIIIAGDRKKILKINLTIKEFKKLQFFIYMDKLLYRMASRLAFKDKIYSRI